MGMSSGKRWGIVMLGCIVGAAIGIGPLLDSTGCVRPAGEHENNVDYDSAGAPQGRPFDYDDDISVAKEPEDTLIHDSQQDGKAVWKNVHRSERSATHLRSDSIRDASRRLKIGSGKAGGKSKKGGRNKKKAEKGNNRNGGQRNLRNDRLD